MSISIRKRVTAVIMAVLVGTVFTITMIPQETSAASVAKVKGFNAIVYANQVNMKWKKTKGAKKYQIYRATTKNGKYKRVKTTSKRTWIDKKKSGLCWYKVRGVRGSKKGSYSTKRAVYRASMKVSHNKTGYFSGAGYASMITALVNNPSKKHNMYMVGMQVYKVIIMDKTTKKEVTTYPAYLSNTNGYKYIAYSKIPHNAKANIFLTTLGQINQSYLDTSKYEIIALTQFTLSRNTTSGMKFSIGGGASFGETIVSRVR